MSNEIHSCSYYCERPACIKAQRDELRDAAERSQAERSIKYVEVDLTTGPVTYIKYDSDAEREQESSHDAMVEELRALVQEWRDETDGEDYRAAMKDGYGFAAFDLNAILEKYGWTPHD